MENQRRELRKDRNGGLDGLRMKELRLKAYSGEVYKAQPEGFG